MILFLLKLTVVLLLGACIAALLRTRSAAARHFVWTVTLVCALLLPLATSFAPVVRVGRVVEEKSEPLLQTSTPILAPRNAAVPAADPAASRRRGAETAPSQPARTPAFLYFAGVIAMLLWLAAGQLAVWRIVRKATPLDDPLIDEARRRMGVKRAVRVALSDRVSAPFTTGWIILLPADAAMWPVERRRAALLHELAHVARNDAPIHLLAGLACALYWPHPMVWIALRRLRREGEQATDDRVITRGMIAPEYAAQLVDVASAAKTRRIAGLAAVAMACPSHLETRLRALLDETRIRGAISRRIGLAVVAVAAVILVPLAGARPATSTYDRTVDAKPGGTLVLELETGGGVTITGGNESRVEVHGQLRGRDAAHTVVDTTSTDDEVRISSTFNHRSGMTSTDHDFQIRVPHKFNVRVSSAGGGVSISDVEGTFAGSTGGGEIELTRVRGKARLSTGGGNITVSDSELAGRVSTGGGAVQFIRVSGGLRGDSGNAENGVRAVEPVAAVEAVPAVEPDVTINPVPASAAVVSVSSDESDGDKSVVVLPSGAISITKDGGQVHIDEAPNGAEIHTGGGRVIVGRARGTVDVSTGGGMIRVGPVAGSVRASTGAGAVLIDVEDAGGKAQTVQVMSGNGSVDVTLPANFDGRFEIETAYTESHEPVSIRSDFDLQYQPVTEPDGHEGTPRRYVRALGSAGRGRGLVRIRTVNGNVTLHRE